MQMNNYSYQLKHIEAAGCSVSTDNSAAASVAYSQDKCTECMQDYEEPSTKLSADAEERCSAQFVMRVTDELSLGHSGVDSLCSATQSNFVETVTDSISHNIKQALFESGITDETLLTAALKCLSH